MELRLYQKTAVERILTAFNEGHQGVFFVMPTGGGKTPVACEVIKRLLQQAEDVS